MSFDPASLPTDVINSIFSYIGLLEISRIQFTSKSWYATAIQGRQKLEFKNFTKLKDTDCKLLFQRINENSLFEVAFHSCYNITNESLTYLTTFPSLYKLTVSLCFGFNGSINLPKLTHLSDLALKYTGVPNLSLTMLTTLRRLKIQHSSSVSLDISPLTNLRELSIPTISGDSFYSLHNLEKIHLNDISPKVSQLTRLTTIKLNPAVNQDHLAHLTSLEGLTNLKFPSKSGAFVRTASVACLTQLEALTIRCMEHDQPQGSISVNLVAVAPGTGPENGTLFLGASPDPRIAALTPLVRLKRLDITGDFNFGSSCGLFKTVGLLPLQTFHIMNTPSNPIELTELVDSMAEGPSVDTLTVLKIPANFMKEEDVKIISRFRNLRQLDLPRLKCSWSVLSGTLRELPYLKALELTEYQDTSSATAKKIPFDVLHLTILNLNDTNFQDADFEGIEHLHMTHLLLSSTHITNRTIAKLKGMTSLSLLSLNKCSQLTSRCLMDLKGLFNLTNVYLNGLEIEEADLNYLPPQVYSQARNSAKLKSMPVKTEPVPPKPEPAKTPQKEKETCLIS